MHNLAIFDVVKCNIIPPFSHVLKLISRQLMNETSQKIFKLTREVMLVDLVEVQNCRTRCIKTIRFYS